MYDKSRDPRKLEPYFSQHMQAMTKEGLYNKDDIAKELAVRDRRIQAMLNIIGDNLGCTWQPKFKRGDRVRKKRGSEWRGRIVGVYSTELTPEGYCVESEAHKGSVQIYPATALEAAE